MCNKWYLSGLMLGVVLLLTACSPVRPPPDAGTPHRWEELQAWSPYPHTTPLPPADPTALDGLYVRFDPRTQERVPCRRCPPYPPEGGVWVLEFERGVFRVYHPRTGWRTLGSYTVNGDEVALFNDPQCHLAVGRYTWSRDDSGLHFVLLNDNCELGTRPKNFMAQAWASCQPPSHEAAAIGHWVDPEGCDLTQHTGAPTPKAPTLSQ